MNKQILYLSYTGMLEPLGASQVLSYVKQLSHHYSFTILCFERKEDLLKQEEKNTLINELARYNIKWVFQEYLPGGKYYLKNVWSMYHAAQKIVQQKKVVLIHARGYLPGMISLWLKKRNKGVKTLFDTRGFWFDEKVDVGDWKQDGIAHTIAKKIEKSLYLKCKHLIAITINLKPPLISMMQNRR